MKSCRLTLFLVASVLAACSTTRVLEPGQKRLVSNRIVVTNDKDFDVGELSPYLKQRTPGWSPMLYVYNWENGKNGGWDRFVHKIGDPPVVFDSTLVENSITNICGHLDYLGYYHSDVRAEIDTLRNKNKLKVKYFVSLGRRFPICGREFVLPEDKDFSEDFLADTSNVSVRVGDMLNEEALVTESVRGELAMKNRGYYDFSKSCYSFEADTVSHPDSALLKIIVRDNGVEFRKYCFGDVYASYPETLRFSSRILEDLNSISEGEMYTADKVSTLYSRLNTVGLFNAVNVRLTPRDSSNVVDCEIGLQKGKIQGFKLGLEASVNSSGLFGISPELSYYNRNIFNGGEVLNVSVSTNNQFMFKNNRIHSNEVSASASLTLPRPLFVPVRVIKGSYIPKTDIKLAYNYQNRPEYERNLFSASYGYTGNVRKNLSYQINPLSIKLIRLPYIDSTFLSNIRKNRSMLDAYADHFDAGANLAVYYSTASSLNPRDNYWYARFQLDCSGNVLCLFNGLMKKNEGHHYMVSVPYSQYVRFELSLGKTLFWGRNSGQSLAMHFMAGFGYAYGNSLVMPLEKQFYGGGANSLRGWTARTVGPGNSVMDTYWSIPNQTGDLKMEANLEYRFTLFWKLAGAVFVDAGNIWCVGRPPELGYENAYFSLKTLPQSLAASWGLGLRVDLSFIVLRLDWGMRFHDPARTDSRWRTPKQWFGNDGYAIHFGVGYPL